jgi:hypothetical protein
VIMGLSETRLFTAQATRWVGSTLLSGLVGLVIGFLLSELGVANLRWTLLVCGFAGLIAAPVVLIIHQSLRAEPVPSDQALSFSVSPGEPNGKAQSDAYWDVEEGSFPPSPTLPNGEGHH